MTDSVHMFAYCLAGRALVLFASIFHSIHAIESTVILSCPQSVTGCVGYEDRSPNWSSPSRTIKPSPDHDPSFASKYSQYSDGNKLDKWNVLQGMLVPNMDGQGCTFTRRCLGSCGLQSCFLIQPRSHDTLFVYVGEGKQRTALASMLGGSGSSGLVQSGVIRIKQLFRMIWLSL